MALRAAIREASEALRSQAETGKNKRLAELARAQRPRGPPARARSGKRRTRCRECFGLVIGSSPHNAIPKGCGESSQIGRLQASDSVSLSRQAYEATDLLAQRCVDVAVRTASVARNCMQSFG